MARAVTMRRVVVGAVVVGFVIVALARSYDLQRFDGLSLLGVVAAVVVIVAAVLGAFDREVER